MAGGSIYLKGVLRSFSISESLYFFIRLFNNPCMCSIGLYSGLYIGAQINSMSLFSQNSLASFV